MEMKSFSLWGENSNIDVTIEYYRPFQKSTDSAVVIFPGGGYRGHTNHEGEGFARWLNTIGVTAFVVNYRVFPNHFPAPLLDARRAMRFVRFKAEEFGINKNKVIAMGSSAGGHLTALLSTYCEDLCEGKDDLYQESYLPNGQILCYPVISSEESISHKGSFESLLGDLYEKRREYSPELLVNQTTPPTFIWHTAEDGVVSCVNSYRYAESLTKKKIPVELHIFPQGVHGLGISAHFPYVAQWTGLLSNWIKKYYE